MVNQVKKWLLSEGLLQIGLFLILLFILAFNKESDPHLHGFEILMNLGKFGIALAINYWLLPKYYYPQKYLQFALGIVLLIGFGLGIERVIIFGKSEPLSLANLLIEEPLGKISSYASTLLLFVGAKLAWDVRTKELEMGRIKGALVESELQFLKSQMNPHFLFNNLNNLYAHALNKSDKTPDIILELSSLLRYMLYDCQAQFVPLDKEFKFLQDYIELQRLQVEERGVIDFKIEGETTNQFIAPLILIAFVENCFKHSLSSQAEQIEIKIHLILKGYQLRLFCSNTFSQNSNVDSLTQGIGLENVKTRLHLLYPNAHQLSEKEQDGFYEIELDLDLSNVLQVVD